MKETAVTVASTEINSGGNRENRAARSNSQERNGDRNLRVSFNDERQTINRRDNDGQNRSRENSRERSWDRNRQDNRRGYSPGPRGRFVNRGYGENQRPWGNRFTPYNNYTTNRRGGPYRGPQAGFNNRRFGTNDISSNNVETQATLTYVMGMFNEVEVPILIDTGSAVTIINEEVWKLLKIKEPLENVPFAIRSVTKHAIEIIGQKEIALQLKSKAKRGALQTFHCKVFVARGLAKEAIMGLDFLKRFEATIDIEQNKLILYKDNVRTVHSLIGRACIGRSIAVVVKEDQIIEAKTEKRVQCALEEELEDGTVVYFEPSDDYLQTVPLSIAGSIDTTKNKAITTQLINPTCNTVEVKGGTIIGTIDTVRDQIEEEASERRKERTSASMDWIKKVNVGKTGFSHDEQRATYDLLQEFEGVFSKGEYDLGRTSIIQHAIEILGDKPRRCGPRPLNPPMRKELEKQLTEMLKNDLIQPSTSEYSCPVVLVKKKCGAIRFCCDFRRLNDATRKDSYPLPRINEIINTLTGAKFFSTMDCKSGYHQLALKPEDTHKTAFATQYGLYEWKVMPMGLCNAPSSWQRPVIFQ